MSAPDLTGNDIGSPRVKGSTTQNMDRIEISAGGRDFWETHDEGHFAHTRVSGDFAMIVRVVSLGMADIYTKAGLMLRSSLEPGAEHAFLLAFGDNQARNKNNGGLEFQYRESTNGPCVGIYPPQPLPEKPDFPASFPDLWLRLARSSDIFTGQVSHDGRHWTTFCTHKQRFPRAAYLGLAVTSHNVEQAVTCVFSNLSLKGTVP